MLHRRKLGHFLGYGAILFLLENCCVLFFARRSWFSSFRCRTTALCGVAMLWWTSPVAVISCMSGSHGRRYTWGTFNLKTVLYSVLLWFPGWTYIGWTTCFLDTGVRWAMRYVLSCLVGVLEVSTNQQSSVYQPRLIKKAMRTSKILYKCKICHWAPNCAVMKLVLVLILKHIRTGVNIDTITNLTGLTRHVLFTSWTWQDPCWRRVDRLGHLYIMKRAAHLPELLPLRVTRQAESLSLCPRSVPTMQMMQMSSSGQSVSTAPGGRHQHGHVLKHCPMRVAPTRARFKALPHTGTF